MTKVENDFINDGANLKRLELEIYLKLDLLKLWINKSKLFREKGISPVVVNSSTNNGIGGYVNFNTTEKGGVVTFSDTTTTDSIFYQPNDFIGYSHVQVMEQRDNRWSEKAYYILFL